MRASIGARAELLLPVPSLEGSKQKRVGTRIATVGITKETLACGHVLDARLGYDRSGEAEASVPAKRSSRLRQL